MITLPDKKKWIEDLKYIMKVNKITQVRLAQKSKLSHIYIHYILNFRRNPSHEILESLQSAIYEIIESDKEADC